MSALKVILCLITFHLINVEVASLQNVVGIQKKMYESERSVDVFAWEHICVGVLLYPDRIVTSCSCVAFRRIFNNRFATLKPLEVRSYSGSLHLNDTANDPTGQIMAIQIVKAHPLCIDRQAHEIVRQFDIALLITKDPFLLGDSLHVVGLWIHPNLLDMEEECVCKHKFYFDRGQLVGPTSGPSTEHDISVDLSTIANCSHLIYQSEKDLVDPTLQGNDPLLCAKTNEDEPLCVVDTGAPIICNGSLVAIVSNLNVNCTTALDSVAVTTVYNESAFLYTPTLQLRDWSDDEIPVVSAALVLGPQLMEPFAIAVKKIFRLFL